MSQDCEHINTTETRVVFGNGTKHVEKRCLDCQRHLGYTTTKKFGDYIFHFSKYRGSSFADIVKRDRYFAERVVRAGALRGSAKKAMEDLLA